MAAGCLGSVPMFSPAIDLFQPRPHRPCNLHLHPPRPPGSAKIGRTAEPSLACKRTISASGSRAAARRRSIQAARPATVGSSNKTRLGIDTPKVASRRAMIASPCSELAPRLMTSSSSPTRSSPSSTAQTRATAASVGLIVGAGEIAAPTSSSEVTSTPQESTRPTHEYDSLRTILPDRAWRRSASRVVAADVAAQRHPPRPAAPGPWQPIREPVPPRQGRRRNSPCDAPPQLVRREPGPAQGRRPLGTGFD